jgi:ABC-type dipeptide/oligopeptide/nickel transport system permease component
MGMVLMRFPATLQLSSVALLLTIGIGLPMGVITAVKKDGF